MNVLDHIYHLSPPGRLEEGIKHFENLGFVALPGGQHADGLTYNAVVVLPDGVFIELIAFVHDVDHYPAGSVEREKREKHWWVGKQPGWLDWAIVTLDKKIGEVINERASAEIYLSPMEAGRTKSDGTYFKFRGTFPAATFVGRTLPIFIEDLTPRDLRAPLTLTSNSQHPCGARGIAHITISTSTAEFTSFSAQLAVIFGAAPEFSSPSEAHWPLKTPRGNGLRHPALKVVASPEAGLASAPTIVEVGFYVGPDGAADEKATLPSADYGAVVWCPAQSYKVDSDIGS